MEPGTPPPPPKTDDALDVAALRAERDALAAEIASLKDALAAAEKAVAELERFRELAARAQADLQNAKARIEREREEIGKYAEEAMMRRLLPTVDNFQRAFLHLPPDLQSHEWVKGITAIEQELMRRLSEAGLTRMDSLGKPIDPQRHEALSAGPGAEGTILEVYEEGYELHGKVLRPSKVKVGDGSAA